MIIGVDARCFLENNFSGVSIYTQQALSYLAKISPADKYILQANVFAKPRHWPTLSAANISQQLTHYPNKLLNLVTVVGFGPYFDHWLKQPDVYWVPANNFINLSPQVSSVFTCHDLSWLVFPEFYSNKGKIWHRALQLEKKYQQADKIIAVSEHTKNDILRFFPKINPDKISVIYSGVEAVKLSSEQIEQQVKLLALPKNYILYLGNIEPRKNLLSLISAFLKLQSKFPDLYLLIAGGDGWHRGYSRRVQKKIAKHPRIKYLGYVNELQKLVLYNQALSFVFPSYYEGFGFPPLEAMTQNCPVIASHTSALPEVIGEAGVLINPFAVNDLSVAIAEIISNENWRQQLKILGQQQVAKFTWEKTVVQMKQLFNHL